MAYAADDRPGVGRIHRLLTRPTARPSGRSPTSRASRESASRRLCRLPQAGPIAATSGLHSAGRMSGVTSTNSPPPACADCQPSPRTYCRALRPREGPPWPRRRRTSPSGSKKAGLSSISSNLAAGKTCSDQSEEQTRRSHPLRLVAMGRPDALHRDGRIELDNNTVERSIRPIALNRKMLCSQALMAAPSTGPPSPH